MARPSREVPILLQRLREDDTTLGVLHLAYNKLTDASGTALAAALQTNTTLRVLLLGANELTDTSGTALAAALQINTALRELHLGANALTDASGTALARALRTNTALLALELGSNQLTGASSAALAVSLQTNTTLRLLHLGDDGRAGAPGTAVAAALVRNSELAACRASLDFIMRKSTSSILQAAVDAMTRAGLLRAVLKFVLPEGIAVGQLSEVYSPNAAPAIEFPDMSTVTWLHTRSR